ncbi:MAG: PLP-dependent aminotransferase family protein [Cyclobacteriaceae bacterium]
MFPWQSIIEVDRTCSVPVYLQVSNTVAKEIQAGRLPAKTRLPSTRAMAEMLQMHRKTVTAAYEELYSQGWVDIKPNKGTFVTDLNRIFESKKLEEIIAKPHVQANFDHKVFDNLNGEFYQRPKMMEINDGLPDERLAPVDELAATYRGIIKTRVYRSLLGISDVQGDIKLREVLAQYLGETRGLNCDADNILITRGGQMSMFLIANILFNKGDNLIVSQRNFYLANQAFNYNGANLIEIPSDQDGIIVSEVEKVCQQNPIKAIFITPHHHHPTTVTCTLERRLHLLELSRRYNFAIIEDDYDYDFHYDSGPILPLASSDCKGNVIYFGSFSKILSSLIRIGYLVAPKDVITELKKVKRLFDYPGDSVMERTLAELIKDGVIPRYLKKALKAYKDRRDLFCQILQDDFSDVFRFTKPSGGMAIWAEVLKPYNLNDLSETAYKKRLFLLKGDKYALPGESPKHIRLGFASLNEKEIVEVLKTLREVANQSIHKPTTIMAEMAV